MVSVLSVILISLLMSIAGVGSDACDDGNGCTYDLGVPSGECLHVELVHPMRPWVVCDPRSGSWGASSGLPIRGRDGSDAAVGIDADGDGIDDSECLCWDLSGRDVGRPHGGTFPRGNPCAVISGGGCTTRRCDGTGLCKSSQISRRDEDRIPEPFPDIAAAVIACVLLAAVSACIVALCL